MSSPWFTDSGSTTGANVAQLLAERNAATERGFQTLGKVGGEIGAGAVGAFQGLKDPSVFGGDTSGGAGAFKGAMQNINANVNGGDNFKQLQHLGKSADAFRSAMKLGQPPGATDAPEQPVLGMTDDEWATKGALEKFNAVGSAVKAQAQQEVMARIAEHGRQIEDDKTAGQFMQNFGDAYQGADDKLDAPTRFRNAFTAALKSTKGPVGRAMPGILNSLDKFAAVANKNAKGVNFIKSPNTGTEIIQSPDTGLFQVDPASKADIAEQEIVATKPAAEDIPEGYMAMRVAKGWVVKPDETQFVTKKDFDGTVTRTFVGKQGGGKQTAKTGPTPAAEDIAFLKSNPTMAAQFDKKFGAGASAQILQQ